MLSFRICGQGGVVSGKNIFEKILEAHGISPAPKPGEPIELLIDQTLTQDATGTLACLQFEALEVPRVRTKRSVSYVDHNTFQAGFQNSDDHRFLQSFAAKYGVTFSGPGNGICHQIHLERFGVPGDTLLGSDSHTSTGGGLGMLAIGAGGLDVAMAMAGHPFRLTCPAVVLVRLEGALSPWVTAKDIILKLLQRVSVKGGVGKVFEYGGPGVAPLSVPERATIANMGAETGATSSIFPSDEVTRRFLKSQGREEDFRPLSADPDASYAEVLTIDLGELEPMVAQPHMPDRVCAVREIAGLKLDQVVIGSCTNSSYMDLAMVAAILKGRSVHPKTSLVIAPGSRQVLAALAESGALNDMIKAGARILECACGPCIGIGQSPPTNGVSLRTFNRNFQGRSGTQSAELYLCSPQVAAVSALKGELTDPRSFGKPAKVEMPEVFPVIDHLFIPPLDHPGPVEVVRGPNIKPLPRGHAMPETLKGEVLICLGDDITTDDIMPAGAHIMSLRSNIPAISEYVFSHQNPGFAKRARERGGGFVVAGRNYGQGSSREHAALAPMVLGIKGVIARSFARIHRANLINFGILPMTFMREEDPAQIQPGDQLVMDDVVGSMKNGRPLGVVNTTRGQAFEVRIDLDEREKDVVMAGGLLEYLRWGSA
ncbi:MAG: aconitate hydratase [Deltaproteobacteria bacterium]|nr:MAG: aconitate hydratase [Deltaproteobacteria bacterium]